MGLRPRSSQSPSKRRRSKSESRSRESYVPSMPSLWARVSPQSPDTPPRSKSSMRVSPEELPSQGQEFFRPPRPLSLALASHPALEAFPNGVLDHVSEPNTAVEPTESSVFTLRIITASQNELDSSGVPIGQSTDTTHLSPQPSTDSTAVLSPVAISKEANIGSHTTIAGAVKDLVEKDEAFAGTVPPLFDQTEKLDLPELGLGLGLKMERCFTI